MYYDAISPYNNAGAVMENEPLVFSLEGPNFSLIELNCLTSEVKD